MTIKVLHLRDTDEVGGPGKTILETVSHIDNKKYQVHIGVFMKHNEKDESPFIKEARERGFNIHILYSFNQYDPLVLAKISYLVKKLKIDIIHTHEILSDILGYMISKVYNIPIITTLHGWINNRFKDRIKISIDKLVIKKFDRIIVVSETMRKQIIDLGIAAEKIKVLYNSIVISNYNHGPKGYLSEVIGRKINSPLIGTIGRLSPEKGHKDFIEAASIVLRNGYDANFVIVGDGPEKDNLSKMVTNLNLNSRIFFTGHLTNIESVYRDLDLMILPSYTEGLPNVVLESLLMEVPVIATRVGGTPEIVRDNETGILINPGFPEEMSYKIIEYLKNSEMYIKMAKNGKSFVSKEFNFNERTKKLELIYEEIMRVRRGT